MNRWFSSLIKGIPGKTPQEERQRRNALVVLISTGAAPLLGLILNAATVPESRLALGAAAIIMWTCAILAWFGIILPGKILAPPTGIAIVAFLAVQGLGVHDTVMLAFFLPIMMAAILLGDKGVIATSVGTVIAATVLAGLEIYKVTPNDTSDLTTIGDVIVLTLSIVTASAILWVVIRQLNQSLQTATENEKNQKETNQELLVLQTRLEQRVEDRTADLNRRTRQLEAAGFVARRAAEISNINRLLDEVVTVIADQFGFYHAGIYVVDPSQRYVELQAASSEGGKKLVAKGQRLAISRQGIVGSTALTRRPKVALDTGNDPYFMFIPELPLTKSEMALPLLVRDQLIGVLDIESSEPSAFSPADLNTFQAMADQVALAIENAKLIEQSRAALLRAETSAAESALSAWRDVIVDKSKVYESVSLSSKSRNNPATNEILPGALKVPLILRGKKIGDVTIAREENSSWSDQEQEMLNIIVAQLGVALDSARALEVSQRSAAREKVLGEMSGQFTSALDVDALLRVAVRELQSLPHVSEASIYLKSPEEQ